MKETSKVKKSGLGMPLFISLLLHIALVVILLWGSNFMSIEPKQTGTMVEAVVIDPNLVSQQAKRIKEQRSKAQQQEQDRLDKLRRESDLLEKNRAAEEERIRKLKEQQAKEEKATREAEKKRAEKEKERKEAEARSAAAEKARKEKQAELEKVEKERIAKQKAKEKLEAETKAAAAKAKAAKEAAEKAEQIRIAKEKAAKEAAEKAEKARIAKEKAAKEAAEKAAKEKAEREAKEKAAREKAEKEAKEKARLEKLEKERLAREKREQDAALSDVFSGLANEAEQNSSARSKFISSELDRYGAIYKQLISSQLLTNDSFSGKSCKVNLRLIPAGGTAVLGKLSVLSGDSAVCAATSAAVLKVNSYPLPNDPDIVEQLKNINLTVEPN
ncbi:cell envelope integrity protein TolA [Vibrio sp. WJH972]